MRRLITLLAALVVAATLLVPEGHIAMATTQNLTFARNVHVAAGTTTLGGSKGFSVPAGALSAIIDTAGNPSGIQFSMEVDATQDGGATWQGWLAADFSSDPATDKLGNPTTQHNVAGQWPGTGMRVIITASAAATLTVSGTLTT